MPGDIVRRMVPGKFTQRGYCSNIRMWADVKVLGTKYVIKNVDAERLRLISTWQSDSAVCLDSWVGSTKEVEEKAILRYKSELTLISRKKSHSVDKLFQNSIRLSDRNFLKRFLCL